MIKNGSFNDGTTGYTVYVDSSAKASHVVDSLKDDNALAVIVENTGDQDWKVQIKQENVKLVNGKIDDEITTLHEVRIDDITLEEVVDENADDSDITDDTESTDKDDTQIDEGNTDNTGDSEIKDDESNKDDTNNNQTPVVKPNKVHETIKEVVKTVAKVINEVLKCIKKIFKFF